MFRSLLLLLSGNAGRSIVLFTRNLAVARLVSVENYGVAATFAVTMGVVELATNIGLHQLIIRARDGDDPVFQARLHGLNLFRSVLSAALLFVLAGPIATFLAIPEAAWAYRILALVPVLQGLQHFDMHRFTREGRFFAVAANQFLPAAIGLAAVWPLYRLIGGYEVMLYSLILQWGMAALISHLVAERPYRLGFDIGFLRTAFAFGWPLLLNSILLFAVMQGDRVIVGKWLGMENLAVFSMGLTLTMTPALILSTSIGQIILPRLSDHQERPDRFSPLAVAATEAGLLSGVVLVVGTAFLGPVVVRGLLGAAYQPVIALLVLFAIQQALRVAKNGVSTAAVARARTSIPMLANAARVLALVPAWIVARNGGSFETIILIGLVGEALGLAISLALGRARLGIALGPLTLPLLASGAVFAATALHASYADAPPYPAWAGALGLVALSLLAALTMRTLRGLVSELRARRN